MSYTDNEWGWKEASDDEDFPDLDTEEGRDQWIEILMSQDDETLKANDTDWCKALTVADEEGNMVIRIVYPDGDGEVFDVTVRRSIEVGRPSDASEGRN